MSRKPPSAAGTNCTHGNPLNKGEDTKSTLKNLQSKRHLPCNGRAGSVTAERETRALGAAVCFFLRRALEPCLPKHVAQHRFAFGQLRAASGRFGQHRAASGRFGQHRAASGRFGQHRAASGSFGQLQARAARKEIQRSGKGAGQQAAFGQHRAASGSFGQHRAASGNAFPAFAAAARVFSNSKRNAASQTEKCMNAAFPP